ncbi:hypothetical protein SCLCIDRAFT_210735 [Scleroderma citrinum Foug A]|uniref:Uncharacterized protein n=1 Tax=Scleroderma citrinum Foug A TaxID=1036808 RepID=A0A0C2ZW57_9AGAM|nr:hypothetical protein SCLCIDRAFT_210735 [Scleroderma citrinum Foug A]
MCYKRIRIAIHAGHRLHLSSRLHDLPRLPLSWSRTGLELSLPTHAAELNTLGIRRILKIAAECDQDDYGLALDHKLEW